MQAPRDGSEVRCQCASFRLAALQRIVRGLGALGALRSRDPSGELIEEVRVVTKAVRQQPHVVHPPVRKEDRTFLGLGDREFATGGLDRIQQIGERRPQRVVGHVVGGRAGREGLQLTDATDDLIGARRELPRARQQLRVAARGLHSMQLRRFAGQLIERAGLLALMHAEPVRACAQTRGNTPQRAAHLVLRARDRAAHGIRVHDRCHIAISHRVLSPGADRSATRRHDDRGASSALAKRGSILDGPR